jgi:hypothetical protein
VDDLGRHGPRVNLASDFVWYASCCLHPLKRLPINHLNDTGGTHDGPRDAGAGGAEPGEHLNPGNTFKDPDRWTTGDEPITGAQRSYLHTLAEEAGVEVDDDLTKAEASKRIDELQEKTGRGR